MLPPGACGQHEHVAHEDLALLVNRESTRCLSFSLSLCAKRSLDFPSRGARERAGWGIKIAHGTCEFKNGLKKRLSTRAFPMKKPLLVGVGTRSSGIEDPNYWDSIPEGWDSNPVDVLGAKPRVRWWQAALRLGVITRRFGLGEDGRAGSHNPSSVRGQPWARWESKPDVGGQREGWESIPDRGDWCRKWERARQQNRFLFCFMQFCSPA